MAKKKAELIEVAAAEIDRSGTFNPLLNSLRENDKRNLFQTNVTTAFHKTGFPIFDHYFGSVVNIHDEFGRIIRQDPRIGQAAGTFNLIVGNTGTGKAQPESAVIPTPIGDRRMGDLKVGDEVFDWRGDPTKIVGVYPQGMKHVYRIHFSGGRSVDCCKEHLWTVMSKNTGEWETISLEDIMNDPDQWKFPVAYRGVKYKSQDLLLDPYLYGVFYAIGIPVSDRSYVATRDEEILQIVGSLTQKRRYDADRIKQLAWKMKKLNKEAHHQVSPYYLYNDENVRRQFLRGIFDICGYIRMGNDGKYRVVCYDSYKHPLKPNSDLSRVISHLARSLGYYAETKPFPYNTNIDPITDYEEWDKPIMDGFVETIIDIPYADFPLLFLRPSKLQMAMQIATYPDHIKCPYEQRISSLAKIESIEPLSCARCLCIKVDNEDELYVTQDFMVTHNTTFGSQLAAGIVRQYPYANVIHYDCEYRFEVSRAETITRLPSYFFDGSRGPERYMIRTGMVGLDTIQEMIVRTYVQKMKLKKELLVPSGYTDEFGNDVMVMQPTVALIDSMTTVMNETFSPDSTKEAANAEKMRGNTEGARDAKTLKGFFKDILPLCKEANIIIYGINHLNTNMSMNAFLPVAKQQNYLKQDEIIPGGRTMVYYPFNIIKLIAKPSDSFTEESDGFAGHIVVVEPIKSSSNQSGNTSHGISFEMVFSFKHGFDSLRSLILYGRTYGMIEGNKSRMKFKDDDSFTFTFKNIYKEKDEKPIWENLKKFVIPHLRTHLSFVEPMESVFDERSMDY